MKIGQVRLERHGDRTRIVALVEWEDAPRAPFELYFETVQPFADGLTCSADPFLIAGILPAWHYGEQRININGDVSPELLQGLRTVMGWLRQWFRTERPVLAMEVQPAATSVNPQHPRHAAFFFSGGVDSLATLRLNRLHFPRSHPGSLRDGLLACGLEIDRPEAFDLALEAGLELAAEGDVSLIPVYTNVRCLDEDWVFYRDEWQGAILAAIGHALANRIAVVSIAATYDMPNLGPWGSHPLLDPNFNTSNVRVHHDGIVLSRLDKLRLLLDWPTALQRMRVCNRGELYRPGVLNCGSCEKCIRTMLELLALEALDRASAFPATGVSEDAVASVYIHDGYVSSCYQDLLAPLRAQGRNDLVRGIKHALGRYYDGTGYRGFLRRIDRNYFNGGLRAVKQAILPVR